MLRRPFTREQRATIVSGSLVFVVLVVVLQLWLLTATMNAYLGGDRAIVIPAALASLACLGLNVGLLVYVRFERLVVIHAAPVIEDPFVVARRAAVFAHPRHDGRRQRASDRVQ